MTIEKYGSAFWEGGLKKGTGNLSTQSGALKQQPYGFNTRFEKAAGTNPEELIGAAHAGCFTMALANMLEDAGVKDPRLSTRATVTLEKKGASFEITLVHLILRGEIPYLKEDEFVKIAENAKENCPVSKLLNATITLDAALSETAV